MKTGVLALLGAGVVSLTMTGCGGTDGASDVNPVPGPNPGEVVTISEANADKVLASSVGGIGRVSTLIIDLMDSLPSTISKGSSGYTVASSGALKRADSKVAFSFPITSKECSQGGSVRVDNLSTSSATVTFDNCREYDVLLNGVAEVSVEGIDTYHARFTNFTAVFSTGELYLGDAGATIIGNSLDFKLASGTAKIQGVGVELKNLTVRGDEAQTSIVGSIKTECLGGWVDVATTVPLQYNSSHSLTGGTLLITGANSTEMILTVNPDGSIDTTLNGAPYASYASASDLPQYGSVCP
jgi:hypothetical protein